MAAAEATQPVRTLDSMPSLVPLYGRAGFAALPGSGLLGRLPLLPGGAREKDLPPERLRVEAVAVERDELARYCRVCGFTLRDTIPATYPHVLSFPLQMELMSSVSFPFPLLGLVHTGNAITRHRPVAVGEPLDLEVAALDLRPHPKGIAFTLLVEARADGELVWEERGTILRRGAGAPDAEREPAPVEPPADVPASAAWRLDGDLGRRYAAVSGDRNPIHIHPLTARAFGFPRPIAHGMWSKARCLAQLEGRIPDAFAVTVSFRKPVGLPGRVRFAAEQRAGGKTGFALRGPEPADPPLHLAGELAPLARG
jgi:acyl dehydratase